MERRLPVLKYLFLFSRCVKGYPSSVDGKRKEYVSVSKVVYKRVLRGWTSERKGASQNKMLLNTLQPATPPPPPLPHTHIHTHTREHSHIHPSHPHGSINYLPGNRQTALN